MNKSNEQNIESLLEYHVAGTVGGQPFSANCSDAYDEKSVAKQNPHLSASHVKAIVAHTETPEFEDGEKHTSEQNGHTVKVTHNGGYHSESVESPNIEGSLNMSEGITEYIDAVNNEDPVTAQDIFNSILSSKISTLIDIRRREVGQSMFKESINTSEESSE